MSDGRTYKGLYIACSSQYFLDSFHINGLALVCYFLMPYFALFFKNYQRQKLPLFVELLLNEYL